MMRNVAIGAVVGFGIMVCVLMFVNREPPPVAVAPVAQPPAAPAEEPAKVLAPTGTAPVMINTPNLVRSRPALNPELLERYRGEAAARVATDGGN